MLVRITICTNVVGKMERSVRAVAIITIVFLILSSALIINTSAKILKENSKQNLIIVDKTDDSNYNSIQEAINDAKIGSTVYVKSGIYEEIIDIRKNINLVGEDRKSTILCPISNKNKYAVRLGAQGIKINNFKITNRAPGLYTTGIKVISSNVEIDACNIYETPVGIAVWSEKATIKNSEFRNCVDEGIAFLGWKGHECNYNKVINCVFLDNCDGVELQYSSYNEIRDCRFINNTHTGIDAIASSNNNNKIINCEIKDNRVNGIYLSSSSDNEIIDCEITNNRDGNIRMNKNSHRNEISFSNELKTKTRKNNDLINNFMDKIKKLNIPKLSEMLSSFSL